MILGSRVHWPMEILIAVSMVKGWKEKITFLQKLMVFFWQVQENRYFRRI